MVSRRIIAILSVCFFTVFSISCNPQTESQLKNIILDTDISSDADDVGAVAVLHELADEGRVNILGMMVSSGDPWSIGCLSSLNRHFNRPDIPLGTVSSENPVVHKSSYTAVIGRFFNGGNKLPVTRDAVELYRELLAGAEDSSVVIVTVGYLTNLKALLQSEADQYSSLNGLSLVEKKVRLLVSMGGDYPEGEEWNFYQDPDAAKYVTEIWPTKIVFAGFSLGKKIITGRRLADLPASNPVRKSYELHNGLKGRPSWDQVAVLFAGFSDQEKKKYFQISDPGKNIVTEDGKNKWELRSDGKHYYLNLLSNKKDVKDVIERMMLGERK